MNEEILDNVAKLPKVFIEFIINLILIIVTRAGVEPPTNFFQKSGALSTEPAEYTFKIDIN